VTGSGREREQELLRSAADLMQSRCVQAARDAVRGIEPPLCSVLAEAARELIARYRTDTTPAVNHLMTTYRARVAALDTELREVQAVSTQARHRLAELTRAGLGAGAGPAADGVVSPVIDPART
jgi:hypothetical protein